MDERWRDLEAHLRMQDARRHDITQPLPAPGSTWSPALAGAAEVVRLVRRLADGAGRDDLVSQLDHLHTDLRVRPVPVLVVGGAGQGKSSLVNALLGASVCPTGPEGTTTVATAVHHAAAYDGGLVFDRTSTEPDTSHRAVPFTEAVALAATTTNPGNDWSLRLVEVGVPSPTLDRGLVLVDTPPITDVWTPAGTRLLRAASGASAVVLVTSAATELTAGELDLLRVAAALCHRVVVAVNGTNAFAQWPSVIERDQLLLEQRGVAATVIPLAAVGYWNEAGGLPPGPDPGVRALAAHLEESVLLDTEHQRISRALVDTFWAADRLRMRLYAERSLIGDADGIDSAAQRLRQAARDAEALCVPSAAWHDELSRGLRDLRRDVERDLEQELAALAVEVQGLAAAGTDPQRRHDAHLVLHHRLADAIVRIHRVRKLALRELCRRVGDRFRDEWTRIVSDLDVASEANSLLNPRLDRPALTGPASLGELPLHPPGTAGAGAPEPTVTADEWLRVVSEFVRADTSDTLERVASDLQHRCQQRAVELHRSIIEVATTLTMVRHLDPETVLQRHEALENDLERLQSLDLQLGTGGAPPAPRGR
jgi:hypothetical protein